MKIPEHLLEHRVEIARRLDVPGALQQQFADVEHDVHAIVVDGRKMVVDQRQSSETLGQQIMSTAQILVQPDKYAPPGSKVTVWKGTPMERPGVVIATAYGRHSIAPESAQMWIV